MNRFHALFLLLSFTSPAMSADSPPKPNIVVILADDFGWGSLGCYGASDDLKTPNLDRLAREGRRFTNAYAPGSVCSPTRYGLMTGRYYWRTSVKDGKVLPGNGPLHIETSRMTLASLCKSQGYRTAAFGKWMRASASISCSHRASMGRRRMAMSVRWYVRSFRSPTSRRTLKIN